MADSKYRKKILFVCRGSACRSPSAKAILRHLLQEREDRNEWEIESAGTHVVREGRKMELPAITEQDKDDFRHFDVILAFDESNVRGLNETFKPNDGTARA